MKTDTWERLEECLSSAILRASPGTAVEIETAASAVGCTFHQDYREFLRRYGGAMVGSYPIFGIHPVDVMGNQWSVAEMTKWFRSEGWPGTDDWYVISTDGTGNPIGVSPDGHVWISDHNVGEVAVIARDFESFIDEHCLVEY
jgi:hypothetical protein